nr:replication protein A 32 kDa subunit B [Tanacetum cinerariifolium]
MYGGDFDGAAAFSGGGFMPSQATQTADHHTSSSSTKSRDGHTLIPLTVNQISKALQSSDDKVNFLIDGVDVNNVKLVGMVLNRAERVTDVSFVLDDGTGRIDCNRWVNDPVDTKEMDAIREGMYVRVHGQLKGFQGKKQLVVFGIKAVDDFDEITHHFVECIYVHSYNTKLMKAGGGNQAHMPTSTTYQTAPTNQFNGQHQIDGISGLEKMVLDYLNLPGSINREAGIHQEEFVKQLGIPLNKMQVALRNMVDEGVIYTSVDDCHFKSIVNG